MLLEKDTISLLLIFIILGYSSLSQGDYHGGYFRFVLKTKTASACNGNKLRIKCPFKTTIAILGAMYGRKVPSSEMCPVTPSKTRDLSIPVEEDLGCEAVTSLPKTARECEGKRICQLLVHPRVFGEDPCPDTTKYLTVVYKCRLIYDELREETGCARNATKLRCPRNRSYIAIYDVATEKKEGCFLNRSTECVAKKDELFDYVTSACHRRSRCAIPSSFCGNFLRVKFACVPKNILTDQTPSLNLSVTVSPPTTDVVTTRIPFASLPSLQPTSRDMSRVKAFPAATSTQSTVTEAFANSSYFTTTAYLGSSITRSSYGNWIETQTQSATIPIPLQEADIHYLSQPIEATNEFPIPGSFDMNSDAPSEPSVIEAINSTLLGGNKSFDSDFGFDILRSFVHLFVYFEEHLDRALAVIFGSLTAALFLALLLVFYFVACAKVRLADQSERTREDERMNLMSSETPNVTSNPPENEDNINNESRDDHGDTTIIPLQGRKRKKRSSKNRILRKFCSCCCSNAPWQRGEETRSDELVAPKRPSIADEDDIISIHCDETPPQFQGPLPYSAREDVVDSPPEGASEQPPEEEDTTSQYEFVNVATPKETRPQRPTTLQTSFHSSPMTSRTDYRIFNDTIPTTSNSKPYTMQQSMRGHSKFYCPRQRVREPPPFPRQGGFNPHHQTVPHWRSFQQQHVDANAPHSVSPIPVQQVPLRSNRQNHYVSLQPSAYEAAQLNGGRRDSFYDNSLPRDSPMYEYYQRQMQQRPELPGTRNINQYYA